MKSVPKSSVSKMDTGEKSGYVCYGSVRPALREGDRDVLKLCKSAPPLLHHPLQGFPAAGGDNRNYVQREQGKAGQLTSWEGSKEVVV